MIYVFHNDSDGMTMTMTMMLPMMNDHDDSISYIKIIMFIINDNIYYV